eukprot:2631727-Rhodomonas_salina.3
MESFGEVLLSRASATPGGGNAVEKPPRRLSASRGGSVSLPAALTSVLSSPTLPPAPSQHPPLSTTRWQRRQL